MQTFRWIQSILRGRECLQQLPHLLLCMCNTSFPYSNHTRVLQQKPTAQVFPLCAAKVARKLFLWTRMVSLKHILFQSSVMQQGLLNIFVCFMENALFQQTQLSYLSAFIWIFPDGRSLFWAAVDSSARIVNDGSAFYPGLNEIQSALRGSLIGGNWMANVSAPLEWENSSRGKKQAEQHTRHWQQPSRGHWKRETRTQSVGAATRRSSLSFLYYLLIFLE